MSDLHDGDDTLPADGARPGTPQPDATPSGIELQHLRAKVHGRLFGAAPRPVVVGRYEVTEYLGSGGMGVVYAAVDPELDRKVALKVLRSDSLGDRARQRLRREAKALARLSHPNVVHVYEVGSASGQTFIAMEFVDGGTLTDWLATPERPWRETLELFINAGRGLAAAHDAGLIHRDFKPDNVLLDAEHRPKVVDFGLVLAKEDPGETPLGTTRPEGDVSLTATGTLMGTPAYMAPEQHRGRAVDARTDIFAFCVALYEALMGERPYAGDTYAALSHAVTTGTLAPPPATARAIPKRVRRAIAAGLSVSPDDRPTSMRELLDALQPATSRRSTWITSAAAGVVALAVGGVVSSSQAPPPAPDGGAVCEGATTKLEGAWDDDTRTRVRDAFAATAEPFADSSFTRVEQALDAWTDAFAQVWSTSCEAALGNDADLAETGMRRMRCLDLRVTELRQLTELFATADAELVTRAVDAADQLTSPSECVDAPLMLATGPTSEEVVQAEQQLARARALAATGRRRQAVRIADAVTEEARRLDRPAIAARAALLSVRAQPEGDIVDRIQRLHRAVGFARSAVDHRTETEAWITMVDVAARSGPEGSAYAELATSWADLAHGLLADHPDARLQVRLQLALAQLSRRRDDAVEAKVRLAKARKAMASSKRVVPKVVARLGALEAEVGQVEMAEQHLRDVVTHNAERLGREHPDTLEAFIRLAAVTADDDERNRLVGEVIAKSVRGGPRDARRAASAITVLGAAALGCTDAETDSGAGGGCGELDEAMGALEDALKTSGSEADEALRIAHEVGNGLVHARRWSGSATAPPPPKVMLGQGVTIEVALPPLPPQLPAVGKAPPAPPAKPETPTPPG